MKGIIRCFQIFEKKCNKIKSLASTLSVHSLIEKIMLSACCVPGKFSRLWIRE